MGTTITSKLRAPVLPTRALPKALVRAAGLLKGKLKKTPLQYQKMSRKEW